MLQQMVLHATEMNMCQTGERGDHAGRTALRARAGDTKESDVSR